LEQYFNGNNPGTIFFLAAAISCDFETILGLKEKGFIPTKDILQELTTAGVSTNTIIAVHKMFDLNDQSNTLENLNLSGAKEPTRIKKIDLSL